MFVVQSPRFIHPLKLFLVLGWVEENDGSYNTLQLLQNIYKGMYMYMYTCLLPLLFDSMKGMHMSCKI